jgi:hypothetical protein
MQDPSTSTPYLPVVFKKLMAESMLATIIAMIGADGFTTFP